MDRHCGESAPVGVMIEEYAMMRARSTPMAVHSMTSLELRLASLGCGLAEVFIAGLRVGIDIVEVVVWVVEEKVFSRANAARRRSSRITALSWRRCAEGVWVSWLCLLVKRGSLPSLEVLLGCCP